MDRLLSLIEHPRFTDRLILRILFALMIVSGVLYLLSLNERFVISIPSSGGTLREGIIGIPRFVNPVLALTRADQDTVALVYSGLMKISPDGTLVPDLAESVQLLDDGITYEIDVRRDVKFHDGTPLTARDVVFTLELIKNPDLKSPLRGNWDEAVITLIDEYRLQIAISEPYYPFIENFTVGILPSHIWSKIPIERLPFSEYNTEPVGSGPFMITKVNLDEGKLISSYLLTPAKAEDQTANLANVELKFFQNETELETALSQQEIDATVFLPTSRLATLDTETYQILSTPLPRVFAVFINQNRNPALRDLAARQALSAAIDRPALVQEVLNGYGFPITGPIVPLETTLESTSTVLNTATTSATDILTRGGWKQNETGQWQKRLGDSTETLTLTLRTGNSPQFERTAQLIAEWWRAIGVEVQVEQYEQNGLVQSVIRTRDFDTLLFGLDLNREQDLYPFWHSSQKDDPALNIAQYANVTVDGLLETARASTDAALRSEEQKKAAQIIATEVPAIFLYAPSITYVIDTRIEPTAFTAISRPTDRFMNITQWYANTDAVWPFFNRP